MSERGPENQRREGGHIREPEPDVKALHWKRDKRKNGEERAQMTKTGERDREAGEICRMSDKVPARGGAFAAPGGGDRKEKVLGGKRPRHFTEHLLSSAGGGKRRSANRVF